MEWKFFLLVASGGALGSLFRAIIAHIFRLWLPWPTILVNVIGAFLIGVCIKHWEQNSQNDLFRAFWIIGLCGGFTTFSAFSLDSINMLLEKEYLNLVIYISVSVFLSVFFLYLGFTFARYIST